MGVEVYVNDLSAQGKSAEQVPLARSRRDRTAAAQIDRGLSAGVGALPRAESLRSLPAPASRPVPARGCSSDL